MEWHYANDGQTNGPVGTFDLKELRRCGVISDETLIWREGFSDWITYGKCRAEMDSTMPTTTAGPAELGLLAPPSEPLAVCSWSGRTLPESEMLRYGKQWVAPEYKDLFVQRLREGGQAQNDAGVIPSDELVTDLNIATILIQTIKIWRINALAILVTVAVISFPAGLIVEYLHYWRNGGLDDFPGGPVKLLRDSHPFESIVDLLAYASTGAVLFAAQHTWAGKSRASIGATLTAGFANWLRLFGTNLLNALIAGLLAIPGVVLVATGNPVFLFLGITYIVVALGIYLVRHSLIDPIAVADSRGGTHALERSREITRGYLWRVLLYLVIAYGVGLGVTFVSSLLLNAPGLDNFVVSAFHTSASMAVMTLVWVFSFVLHRHLEANPAPIQT